MNGLLHFADDKEKMIDFNNLTKEEFLSSYSYLTEEEYNDTVEYLSKTMTAEKLDIMVNAMRNNYNKINTRMDITNNLLNLCKGLYAIERKELAEELLKLYLEIDDIPTEEIIKIGTFR